MLMSNCEYEHVVRGDDFVCHPVSEDLNLKVGPQCRNEVFAWKPEIFDGIVIANSPQKRMAASQKQYYYVYDWRMQKVLESTTCDSDVLELGRINHHDMFFRYWLWSYLMEEVRHSLWESRRLFQSAKWTVPIAYKGLKVLKRISSPCFDPCRLPEGCTKAETCRCSLDRC